MSDQVVVQAATSQAEELATSWSQTLSSLALTSSTKKYWPHTFSLWDAVWTDSQTASATHKEEKFATLFQYPPDVVEYTARHQKANGEWIRDSIEGWRTAVPGMVCLDIDWEEDLQVALDKTRTIVSDLLKAGVNRDSFRIFFSGGKGFSLHSFFSAFGMPEVKARELRHAHEEAVLLAAKILAGTTYSSPTVDKLTHQTLRLFRLPNSYHKGGKRWKIPLTPEELLDPTKGLSWVLELATRGPRAGVPLVPLMSLDHALQKLSKPVLDAHFLLSEWAARGRRILGPRHLPTQPARQQPASFPSANDVPPSGMEGTKLLVERSLFKSAKLAKHWNFASAHQSTHDFGVAAELYKLGWDEQPIQEALWARPLGATSRGMRSKPKGWAYAERTVRAAIDEVEKRRAILAGGRPTVLARQEAAGWQTWLFAHPGWKRMGKAQEVYSLHLAAAGAKADYVPIPGTQSKSYFLAFSEIASPDFNGVGNTKAIKLNHRKLIAAGFLTLVSKGTGKTASSYRVSVPTHEELHQAMRLGIAEAMLIRKELADKKAKHVEGVLGEVAGPGKATFSLVLGEGQHADVGCVAFPYATVPPNTPATEGDIE